MPLRDFESWMWAEAWELLDQADRLHRQFFRPAVMNAKRCTWEPPVDVYETRDGFIVMMALPGVAPEHVRIILEDDHLIIEGQRHLPISAESHIRRLEIPYGRFNRHIALPAGHLEIDAREFMDGCLLISLRKI